MVRAGVATVIVGVDVTGVEMPPPETFRGMLTGVPFEAVTFPVTVIGGKLWPAESASVRVHVPDDTVQVQPVPAMAVMVKPVGGSATVTVPLVAALPVLETVMLYVAFCSPLLKLPWVVTLAVRAGAPLPPPPPPLPPFPPPLLMQPARLTDNSVSTIKGEKNDMVLRSQCRKTDGEGRRMGWAPVLV